MAPKIIGESTYRKSNSGKSWSKSNSKLPGADLVTFGSLPVNHRAYAKFGGDDQDTYALDTVAERGQEYEHVGKKGHVNTRVVGGGQERSDSRQSEQTKRSGSMESQAPIMGLAGINKTTRIEVSYDVKPSRVV